MSEVKKTTKAPRQWSEYEDNQLKAKINDKKVKFLDIAREHSRTPIAVLMRAVDILKLVEAPELIYGYDEYKKSSEYDSDMLKVQHYRAKRDAPPVSKVKNIEEIIGGNTGSNTGSNTGDNDTGTTKGTKSGKISKSNEIIHLCAEIELLKKSNAELLLRVSALERYLMK